MTERYTRRDVGHMDIDITIDDPKAYVKPWHAKVPVNLLAGFRSDRNVLRERKGSESDVQRTVDTTSLMKNIFVAAIAVAVVISIDVAPSAQTTAKPAPPSTVVFAAVGPDLTQYRPRHQPGHPRETRHGYASRQCAGSGMASIASSSLRGLEQQGRERRCWWRSGQ